jgi:hypothetical protein
MKPLTRSIVLFGSLLFVFLPKKITRACGFGIGSGEYRFWLLQPDIVNEPDLTPFFFSAGYLYNGDQNAAREPSDKQNILEWYNAANRTVLKNEIDTILNYTSPSNFISDLGILKDRNTFCKWLLRPENKEFYSYMVISKKIEQIAANPDPWEEGSEPDKNIPQLIQEANLLYRGCKNRFIRLRVAFQLERLYFLNNEGGKACNIYDSLIAPIKTNSWIKTAALYKTANRLPMATKQHDYILSKVFDKGGYHRTACLVKFNSATYKETLSLAKNLHERNVITAMALFNYSGRSLNEIEKIYLNEPKYKEIAFLLLREINKLEDWLVTNKVTEFAPAVYNNDRSHFKDYDAVVNYKNDKVYGEQLYSFLQKIIIDGQRKDLGLLNIYAAYLATLQKNNAAAATHLFAAKKARHTPANVKTQIKISSFLLHLQVAKKFTPRLEKELMQILHTHDSVLSIYDPTIMRNQLVLYTARKAMEKGEIARGILLLGKTNRAWGQLPIGNIKNIYQELEEKASSKDFNDIIALIDKKHKTEFENFITGKELGAPEYYSYYFGENYAVRLDKDKLLDCKATYYIKKDCLDSAIQILSLLPDSLWRQEPYVSCIAGNPFYLNVYCAHKVDAEEGMSCNKKEIVEEMLLLQRKIEEEPSKAAEYNYQLANAWYNMTYFGKNWLMMKQWWSVTETSSYSDTKQTAFNDLYFGCNQAKKYYLKAMDAATDKRLQALCCFMAGKCDENYRSYIWYAQQEGWDKKDFHKGKNPYLKQLGDDTYYKEMVGECELYESYSRKYGALTY